MKTWKKNIPDDYKIIILDYSNIKDYLSIHMINKILCKDMTLATQADAIRIAILHKYGGFWMDTDTILINNKFIELFNGSDLIMFGWSKYKCKQYTGFIYASNKSKILKIWLDKIIEKVKIYKNILKALPYNNKKNNNNYQKFMKNIKWSYLSNGIIDNLVENVPEKDYKRIEIENVYALPDQIILKGPYVQRYVKFYFSSLNNFYFLKKCKGVLLLHNSWTPKKYKKMSDITFLKQKFFLSYLISNILAINNTLK